MTLGRTLINANNKSKLLQSCPICAKLEDDSLLEISKFANNLLRLLAKASWDLECGYGDHFKSIVSELAIALHDHHDHELALTSTLEVPENEECDRDKNLLKIKERILSPWKETKPAEIDSTSNGTCCGSCGGQ